MIYTVRPGDTLAEIARRFGISLARLVQLNPDIQNINQINIGQQIFIPDDATPTPTEPEPVPLPRPVRSEYAIRRVNNLLLVSFANKSIYRSGETVVFYLVKINIGNSPISLHYRTAQRFDFTARANSLQWTWSRGRSFASQQADIVIRPGECEVYTANWDQQSDIGRQMRRNINITALNVAERLRDETLTFSINLR